MKKILNSIKTALSSFNKSIPFVWKTIILLVIFFIITFLFFLEHLYSHYDYDFLMFEFLFISIVISIFILYNAIVIQKIKNDVKKTASGDLEHKINTKFMVPYFKDFSKNINSITDGIQIAVDEKMKSELFKTELITNVSHDIKTPLTSIINYVDLLKKEDIENNNAKEYIAVLDRQSMRLKKLIEDLIEASKASTGNLKVNLEECNIGLLLTQVLGEFDGRFKKANVLPILSLPENTVFIKADARHLWRIIDNIINNICKYSQTDTRAYIDVVENKENTVISFKNTSCYELNISSEQLMERFVRGDRSRHTEGSGLGLSIAKSLTELQNGRLKIDIDGDLFKVYLIFENKV